MRVSIGCRSQPPIRQTHHFVRHIHAVNLGEVLAEGPQQASGAAPEFERRVSVAQAPQLAGEKPQYISSRGKKLLVILFAAAEGDVIICVFPGARVPVRAHSLQHFGIVFHLVVVILTSMAIAFRRVSSGPLQDFDAAAPDGVVIGVIGENGSGKSHLLRLAAGMEKPDRGSVDASGAARLLIAEDALSFAPAAVLAIDQTFARHDALVRERAAIALDRMRRGGSTILLISHEEALLRRLADEILSGFAKASWPWPRRPRGNAGGLSQARRRAHPRVGLDRGPASRAAFTMEGDGRAEVLRVETIGEDGRATMVWRSGELADVKIQVKFHEAVADPVIGMMIRTRIGLNVYGTNTE